MTARPTASQFHLGDITDGDGRQIENEAYLTFGPRADDDCEIDIRGDRTREATLLIVASTNLLAALKCALPYVDRIAETAPTEMNRLRRQREAVAHARMIRDAIAAATEASPGRSEPQPSSPVP